VTPRSTIVGRLRLGTVLGSKLRFSEDIPFIPLQERLYAGGANTVRGFTQNGLGALVYKMANYDTVQVGDQTYFTLDTVAHRRRPEAFVPTGGNSLVVGNLELRVRGSVFHQRTEWVAFVDAGQVWTRGAAATENLSFGSIKVTPGFGVRYFSDFGPLRLDVGYNPYPNPAGAAYFVANLSESGATAPLFCVSPGNTLPVTLVTDGMGGQPQQAPGPCPTSYVPPSRPGFFRRFALQISIGQAF
jgi:outer membrane protein insertion porin family/translocation and assembly module TamA